MWLGVGVSIGVMGYVGHKLRKKWLPLYPAWTLTQVDDSGNRELFRWDNVKIYKAKSFTCYGTTKDEDFNVEGTLSEKGILQATKTWKSGKVVNFQGKMKEEGIISGVWNVKGESHGTFEISFTCSYNLRIHRELSGAPVQDDHLVILSNCGKYLVGFGLDKVGFYRLIGKLKEDKLTLTISYTDKFSMNMKGKFNRFELSFEGSWEIPKGGKGECFAEMLKKDTQAIRPQLTGDNYQNRMNTTGTNQIHGLQPPLQSNSPMNQPILVLAPNPVSMKFQSTNPFDSQVQGTNDYPPIHNSKN